MVPKFNIVCFLFPVLAALSSCSGQPTAKPLQGAKATALPDSTLIVYVDKKGTQWFGTNGRGLFKFEHNTLTQFTTEQGLSDNVISAIKEDAAGNIYVSTANGICRYNGTDITKLIAQTDSANNWSLNPGDLWFKNAADDGHPYRYDGKQLYRLSFPKNLKEDAFKAMFPNTPYSPYGIYTIYTDSKGRVWFGTAVLGVGCYDGKNFTWITEDDLTELHNGPSNGLRSIIEDKNGDFWFSNTYHRYTISQQPGQALTYQKKPGIAWPDSLVKDGGFEYLSATVDTTGAIWIATYDDGVFRYNLDNTCYHYTVKNNDSSDAFLFSAYTSQQGVLWLGSHSNGAYTWDGTAFVKRSFN